MRFLLFLSTVTVSSSILASEKDYSDFDLKAVNNGCGPEWLSNVLPKWLKKWFWGFVDGEFAKACKKHDMRYHRGGSEKYRKYADKEFYKDMKKIVKLKVNFWLRWKHYFKAWRFYKLVRQFGKTAFNYQRLSFFQLPRFERRKIFNVDYSSYYWNRNAPTPCWERVRTI